MFRQAVIEPVEMLTNHRLYYVSGISKGCIFYRCTFIITLHGVGTAYSGGDFFVTTFILAYCEHHGVDIGDYVIQYIDWIEGLVARLDKDEGESKRHD